LAAVAPFPAVRLAKLVAALSLGVDLGFGVERASLMADDSRVDLAQARKLVALGCPLETA